MMDTSSTINFESWFEEQKKQGLRDIKLAISSGKDASVRAVQQELLNSEVLLRAGMCEPLPVATSFLQPKIKALIESVHA